MLDETARRYGRTPATFLAKSDDDPIVASWFDLILSRLCAEAAVETQRQWLRRNGESVLWSMPVPGS
jgi:hypothetical protein